MPQNFVRVAGIALAVTVLSCASHKETAPPTIHVNQRGLAERIAQTSSAPTQSSQEEGSKSHIDAQGAEEASLPGIVRKDPSPSDSGERVAFRRAEGEKTQSHAPPPAVDFDSLRDPRTEEFRRREEERGRE